MHHQLQYYVKHAYGVSLQFNEYSPQHPWCGAGQGAGATIRWAVLSHSLLSAYKSQAKLWIVADPTTHVKVTQGIDAFWDDTSLINAINHQQLRTSNELLQTIQTNLNLWNNLLEASGGALNPTKCTWAHFQWQTHHSLLALQPHPDKPETPQILLSHLGNNPQLLIKLLPHTPYHYLGVYLTMNGDWKKELQVLQLINSRDNCESYGVTSRFLPGF